MKAQGWRIRFRLDALAPVPGWEEDLKHIMERINQVGPEMLTIGALRATNVVALQRATAKNGRNASIFDYVHEKDPSGFKYRVEHDFHVEVFRRVAALLRPEIRLGLCKEDTSVWKAVGLKWNGCHCLHSDADAVVCERGEPKQLIRVLSRQRGSAAISHANQEAVILPLSAAGTV